MTMGGISASLGGILNPNSTVKGVLEGATFARGTKGEGEKEEGDGARGRRENEREENESESESESESEESEGEEEGPRTRMNTSSNDDSLKEEEAEGTSGGQVGRQSMDLRIEQGQYNPPLLSLSSLLFTKPYLGNLTSYDGTLISIRYSLLLHCAPLPNRTPTILDSSSNSLFSIQSRFFIRTYSSLDAPSDQKER